jgi:hypothetical protein
MSNITPYYRFMQIKYFLRKDIGIFVDYKHSKCYYLSIFLKNNGGEYFGSKRSC